jgi:hypothetical protein
VLPLLRTSVADLFGDEAVLKAARRADELGADGDVDAQLAWVRIGEAACT